MVRTAALSVALLLCTTLLLRAQQTGGNIPFIDHTSLSGLELSAPGAMGYGLYGFSNPALLGPMEKGDLRFVWSDGGEGFGTFERWGLFTGGPGFGFGVIHNNDLAGPGLSVTDYRMSFGGGNRFGGLGFGYGWSSGDGADSIGRKAHLSVGILARPNRYLSIGLNGLVAFSGGGRNGVAELAVRPFGNELVTLFGDASWRESDNFGDAAWSAGAVLELLKGIRLTGRYFENEALSVGIGFSLGSFGVESSSIMNAGDDLSGIASTHGVRSGYYDRNIFRDMNDRGNYLVLDLRGGMAYRTFLLFDGRRTLRGTLDEIAAAQEDGTIGGIAVNTSGMTINREMLGELRDALARFRAAGKHVVVFIDRPSIDEYHFASVADRVVIDPMGGIELRGYAAGRSYYREMLDDLGIGFEELRLYRYKSAVESFAREEMSEGEREQLQRMVDVLYEHARSQITASRGITFDEFDRIVDELAAVRAADARRLGLVDTLARWDAVGEILRELGPDRAVGSGSLARYQLPTDDRWSEPDAIAVLYAAGVCAMDEGINARELSQAIRAVAHDDDVKAVVLRVDSPGGDGLASDLVAEAMEECSERKPLVVSQGYVAASGGYWISMNADVIVASTITFTGSIGVISSWIYDKGAFDSIGTNFSWVQRGRHSDLGIGPTLPMLGVGLPHRNMTEDEIERAKGEIEDFYQIFIGKVAEGRGMSREEVADLAQGRVWVGLDAERNGLVDSLGGLDVAIGIARDRAGIDPDEEIRIIEYPAPSLFNPSILTPSLVKVFGGEVTLDEEEWTPLEELYFRLEHNGRAMPMLPTDDIVR